MRVAVVGAGLMGRWHAYFAQREGATVAAVVDRSPEAASRLARRAQHAAVFAEMGEMLDVVRPDVVHICTPRPSHNSLALQAVEAGVHALVEKPLTHLAGDAEALLLRALERNVQVCPVHQFAFQPGVARSAHALARLGDVLRLEFTICSAGGGLATGSELDAVVADILPHPFSVLQALWPGIRLVPEDWEAASRRHGDLQVQGSVRGAAVSIYVSMHARPTRCDLEILCSDGSIHLNFFHGYAVVQQGRTSRIDKAAQPFLLAGRTFATAAANLLRRTWRREPAYPGLGALVGRFYASVNNTGRAPISAQDALAVARVREHIIRQSIPELLLAPSNNRRRN